MIALNKVDPTQAGHALACLYQLDLEQKGNDSDACTQQLSKLKRLLKSRVNNVRAQNCGLLG